MHARTAREAREILHERAESVGAAISVAVGHIFDGYDIGAVLSALTADPERLIRRTKIFSADAHVRAEQAFDLSVAARRTFLRLAQSGQLRDASEAVRAVTRLNSIETLVTIAAAPGEVKPRSKAIADALALEYEQAALAFYRALEKAAGRRSVVRGPRTSSSPRHEAAASAWMAAKARRHGDRFRKGVA